MSAEDSHQYDRTVRVFVSSTFRDMQAERDVLVTVVFPELRERLARLGLDLYDVDLRWGVPETGVDGERANSWAYCKQWIERVEPFFVGLLGQRYGWRPPAAEIRDIDDRAAYDGLSITEMEIRHAVLSGKCRRRSFFYFRRTKVPEDTASRDTYATFVDADGHDRLERLKATIHLTSGRPVREYEARWAGSGFADLDAFGAMVVEDLWSGVLRDERYAGKTLWRNALGRDPDVEPGYRDESAPIDPEIAERLVSQARPAPLDPREAEAAGMAAFAAGRLRWFQGREAELRQLRRFVDDASPDTASRLAVVRAASGAGKTTLMAKFAEQLSASAHLTISHFIGATARSADLRSLLENLVTDLDRVVAADSNKQAVYDLDRLVARFASQLLSYGDDRRLVVLIDGVNQLSDGRELFWLPGQVGTNVRLVVSCIDDPASDRRDAIEALERRQPAPEWVKLGGIAETDVRQIVDAFLLEYGKELDHREKDAIAAMPAARNPLYLMVMLHELRTLGGQAMEVGDIIRDLPGKYPDAAALFDWVLARLEVFGRDEVALWCSYLLTARAGLASRELSELLSERMGPAARPAALRIERGLRRYLQARGPQLDFFHGQLAEAASHRYPVPDPARLHAELAEYFRGRLAPLFQGDSYIADTDTHALSEVAFHQLRAGDWQALAATLGDLRFIEAKCRAGMTMDLVGDYAMTRTAPDLPAPVVAAIDQHGTFVTASSHVLVRHPELTLQEAFNYSSNGPVPRDAEAWLRSSGRADQLWWRRLNRSTEVRPACLQTLDHDPVENTAARDDGAGCLALAPDGRKLLTGGKELQLWDLVTGAKVRVLRGHASGVAAAAWLPGDAHAQPSLCASGGKDGQVRIWDTVTGRCMKTFDAGCGRLVALAATSRDNVFQSSSSGYWLIACGYSGISIRDPLTGAELSRLESAGSQLNCLALSPPARRDDRWIVVGGCDNNLARIWDLLDGRLLPVSLRHESTVRAVAVAFAGTNDHGETGQRLVLTGSWDQAVKLWDPSSGRCLRELSGHRGLVYAAAIGPDGRTAATGGWDKTVRVWDLENGDCRHVFEGHTSVVNDVVFDSAQPRVLSASAEVKIWDLTTGAPTPRERHRNAVRDVRIGHANAGSPPGHAGGLLALSAAEDATVKAWDVATGEYLATLQPHAFEAFGAAVLPDGDRVLTLNGGPYQDKCGEIKLWDLRTGRALWNIEARDSRFLSIELTPDATYLVSSAQLHLPSFFGTEIKLWHVGSGTYAASLTGPHGLFPSKIGLIYKHFLVPGGRYYVFLHNYHQVGIVDLHRLECRQILEGSGRRGIAGIDLAPDGRSLAAWSDGRAWIWDLAQGGDTRYEIGDGIREASWTPDGRRLLVNKDTTLSVLSRARQEGHALRPGARPGEVFHLGFSGDGRYSLESGESGFVLRNLRGLQAAAICPSEGEWVAWRLAGDGRTLVAGDPTGGVKFWRLEHAANEPLWVTAVRVWCHGDSPRTGEADRHPTAVCPACARRFVVAEGVLDVIRQKESAAVADRPPALAHPDEAYEDPALLSDCPHCRWALRFHPFLAGF